MPEPTISVTPESFTFVPADPPYVLGHVKTPSGAIAREFRYYDLRVLVRAVFGPSGANTALEEWIDYLSADRPHRENVVEIDHAAASLSVRNP